MFLLTYYKFIPIVTTNLTWRSRTSRAGCTRGWRLRLRIFCW